MTTNVWQSLGAPPVHHLILLGIVLLIAFGFEFINGFHDTANAVATVIYTNTLRPTRAVVYSGVCNFLGVLVGGTAVAFSIVNLLPVDLLIETASVRAVVMIVSLMLAGLTWNLATWWCGLPVSSSHTLIGSILGVGLANSLLTRGDLSGINGGKALEVGLSLLISPLIGFVAASGLLLTLKRVATDPKLYEPPGEGDPPPRWIRGVLLSTCGGVSFAHGSNDGQKGMGLILLVLIGFLPTDYALDLDHPRLATDVREAAISIRARLEKDAGTTRGSAVRSDLDTIIGVLAGKSSFAEVEPAERWKVRQAIYRFRRDFRLEGRSPADRRALEALRRPFSRAIEFVPTWVKVGVALALGLGTMIGYRRIVVTVAEKIGKAHLTYAQGAAAELVAAATIGLADLAHLPVSTTHVLSSGVAGTMWANHSGLQSGTIRRIGLAWVTTLPAATALAAALFVAGGLLIPGAGPSATPKPVTSADGTTMAHPRPERTARPATLS